MTAPWTPPEYDFTQPPKLSTELNIASNGESMQNFPRAARWCADGSSVLAQCENHSFQIFDANVEDSGTTTPQVNKPRIFAQSSPILDFLWYLTATTRDPASYCFLASIRECPVKLINANTGRLRASYRIVDHRERQIAPHSLMLNLGAQKLYCGFEDAIEVFDMNYPGEGTRLHTTPSKKSKDGLKGIVSALAFSPSYESDYFAAGTLSTSTGNIAMLSESQGETPVSFVGNGSKAPVTQLMFSPTKPYMLYASFRRREEIHSWDLRSNVDSPMAIYKLPANGSRYPHNISNQRRKFDIDFAGRWLSVGTQQGDICIFDLDGNLSDVEEAKISHSAYKFAASSDSIGSVCFHPLRPAILTASGSRHFSHGDEAGCDSNDDTEEHAATVRVPTSLEASIKVWEWTNAGQ